MGRSCDYCTAGERDLCDDGCPTKTVGIRNRDVLNKERIVEIEAAIVRYALVNFTIPKDWLAELKELKK